MGVVPKERGLNGAKRSYQLEVFCSDVAEQALYKGTFQD